MPSLLAVFFTVAPLLRLRHNTCVLHNIYVHIIYVLRFAALLIVAQAWATAQHRYPVSGLVLSLDRPHQSVLVSHGSIPGYMDAMTMAFHVRRAVDLAGIHPGDAVAFTLVVDRNSSWAEDIRAVEFDSAERDPVQAGRLKLLGSLIEKNAAVALTAGDPVPDFTLTDQTNHAVTFSQFAGAVVAINFVYSRCPLPDYCFRLSNNFGLLQKRFGIRAARAAGEKEGSHAAPNRDAGSRAAPNRDAGSRAVPNRDLVLLTVTFDPVNDRPDVLARYAQIWKADPEGWHFLTGPVTEIQHVCALFGVGYWPDEGLYTHALHTAVIDRQGKLVANLEGNRYTAQQLGDLVETVIKRPR